MKEIYKDAFAEVNEILKLMPKSMVEKIPNGFQQIIQDEKSSTYIPNIKEPLEECSLLEETTIILALIYRDFLCDKDEKERLKLRDAQQIKEAEDELYEKYNPDNLFKNRTPNKSIQVEENVSLVKYEEDKWYKKIWNKILHLFKK